MIYVPKKCDAMGGSMPTDEGLMGGVSKGVEFNLMRIGS